MADELERLGAQSILERVVKDYYVVREEIRECDQALESTPTFWS